MVTRHGARSFVFQYRNAHHVSRRWTWDDASLALSAIRTEAKKLAGDVARGQDPVADRRREREAARVAAGSTVQAICDLYLDRMEKLPPDKRLRSLDQKRDVLERLVYPHIGNRPIGGVRRGDITRMLDNAR